MTYEQFIGTIIFMFMLDYALVVYFHGILGLFYRPIGDRYLGVVIKNN